MNCPFCQDNIREIAFHESRYFLAIYNRAPILPGHSLLISKAHVKSLMDFEEVELAELMLTARQSIKLLLQSFSGNGFNISLQDGKYAGQTVEHFHMHLLPRKKYDLPDPGDWYALVEENEKRMLLDSHVREKISREQLKQIAHDIRNGTRPVQ